MSILIVGAGATGGYMGSKLVTAGRDVTFLVHGATARRLGERGLQIQTADDSTTVTPVTAVTREHLRGAYDVVVVAVRAGGVATAVDDVAPAVGQDTVVVPVVNGIAHLDTLVRAFGRERVSGGAAEVAVSMRDDGVIAEVRPGMRLQIGALAPSGAGRVGATARVLDVDGISTTVSDDVVAAMWAKFAFITATSTLTCLLGDAIGRIARTPGGDAVAAQVLAEVSGVAAAEGNPLSPHVVAGLRDTLTDRDSPFVPSMFRDRVAGRPVETDVLQDLVERGERHGTATPLLRAALVALRVHNRRDGSDDS